MTTMTTMTITTRRLRGWLYSFLLTNIHHVDARIAQRSTTWILMMMFESCQGNTICLFAVVLRLDKTLTWAFLCCVVYCTQSSVNYSQKIFQLLSCVSQPGEFHISIYILVNSIYTFDSKIWWTFRSLQTHHSDL